MWVGCAMLEHILCLTCGVEFGIIRSVIGGEDGDGAAV